MSSLKSTESEIMLDAFSFRQVGHSPQSLTRQPISIPEPRQPRSDVFVRHTAPRFGASDNQNEHKADEAPWLKALTEGIRHFQSKVFPVQRTLFEKLSLGQSPKTLFITCSDSRIDPNLLTQSAPGELFIIRNAGNIIPPYGPAPSGETASIEYAISALGVKDVVVCGHSQCGAMSALLEPEHLKDLPAVRKWLKHAETTQRIIKENHNDLRDDALLTATIEENVLTQLQHLANHPAVAAKLAKGELRLHGWVYHIKTGEVHAYDPDQGRFVPLREIKPVPVRPTRRGESEPNSQSA